MGSYLRGAVADLLSTPARSANEYRHTARQVDTSTLRKPVGPHRLAQHGESIKALDDEIKRQSRVPSQVMLFHH